MITIFDAIRSVYPNAVTIHGDELASFEVLDIDSKPITIVPETVTAKLAELQATEIAAEQAASEHKSSALSKLAALGLTQDEINALIG